MKKLFLAAMVSSALLAGCATDKAQPPETATASPESVMVSPNDDRQYETFTLPNQLEVILVSDPTAEKSAASLSVSVGLLHDPMSQQGMAHYLEHMLFLGTERYPDTKGYTEFMTANGGQHNAYTWLDITNYMFKINNDAYGEALDRFSDFFKAPKLYPEYTEKEKNAVNAEWSMRREMDYFGQFKLARSMMGEHPANRFLIGNLETLGDKEGSKLHSETVNFYQRYYSANIMKLAMISNRPLAEMKALATQYFGDIKNKNIDNPTVDEKLDFSQVGGKRIHYVPNEDVKKLNIDFTIRNNSDEFAYKPNQFLTYLIGSEMPGTPAYQLKAMGLISNLSASASPAMYGNYGSFSINIDLTDAGMQNREAIVAVVMQYIDLIRQQGVDEKYFSEIQTSLNNRFRFLQKTDAFGYVSNLAAAMQEVPAKFAVSSPYYYESFNAEVIKDVLAQLTPQRVRVWYISKDEPSDSQLHFYDGKYKIESISNDEIASWQQPAGIALNLPAVNRLLPEHFALKQQTPQSKPELVIDNDKIKVWSFPSQAFTEQPRGEMTVYINSGLPESDIKATVMTALWKDLYTLQQSALMTEAGIAGMSLRFDNGNGISLAIGGFTDKQPQLLSQALDGLTVEVNDQNFAQAVDRYVRGLQNAGKKFPFYQAFDAYNDVVREGNFNTDALIAAAQSLTVADMQAFMPQLLGENQLRIFAFGNYDKADLAKAVERVNAALPAERKSVDYDMREFWQPQPAQKLVWQQDLTVADVAVIDVMVHPQPGYKTKAAGAVLRGHFSNVAFDKLRTEEQLAYAVGGTATNIGDYTGFAMYIQTPVKDVAAMQARFDQFKTEYKTALDALTPDEFAQLKASVLVTLKEAPKNMRDEVVPFIADWYREKFDFDSKQRLIAAVENVTIDDVKAFYQQTMLNDNAARVSVQLRGTSFADQPFAEIAGAEKVADLARFHQNMTKQ
ncbi:insulinase family protein [Alteromonas lipolytica]|uniref:Protease 3 n=1 Tax=Alteromonas lipolytica TaxID=1856405 RepID=A0A1E8FCP9_9ALTE|nr:insulinase family protein [Alteromonas lipolytica]OFI33689.1 peptidase M16 [Alteromonas lipolytica]GGF69315.1 pitrilysin [Alteromonas lipolytica]